MAIKIIKNRKAVKENKQPRIVEYISPERKELNKRAAKINDKWYKDVTEDDIQFLKDNGLDYDVERRSVVFADTRQKVDFPYYSWSWDKENGNVDWIDKTAKASERDREFDSDHSTRLGRKNHSYRTSGELERTSKELANAKRWGTERQEKVWQGKHDREEAKLDAERKDAYNKEWRAEQNRDMSRDYRTLSYINKNLNPSNHGYDARIEYAQKRKADREQELLQRYKDELDRYQRDIDDAKAVKDDALKRKAQILRKPIADIEETEVEEVKESCKRESIGSDLGEFQKWVDYDMDKYGEVSKNTMSKIRKAGLTLVKDDYGDWEVIAKKPIKRDESDNPDDNP